MPNIERIPLELAQEMRDSLHPVIQDAVAASQRIHMRGVFLDWIDIQPAPENRTAGLMVTLDGRVLFRGEFWPIPPQPPYPARNVDPEVRALLDHFELYARNPWVALSKYSHDMFFAVGQPCGHQHANAHDSFPCFEAARTVSQAEWAEWLRRYRTAVHRVVQCVDANLEMIRPIHSHLRWAGPYPSTYHSRPRMRLPGYDYVPVYRVLWPLLNSDTVMPEGRPRKKPICSDLRSPDEEGDFIMCVNPRHFETPSNMNTLSHHINMHTRRGVANEAKRSRWNLRDIGQIEKLADGTWVGRCPRNHVVPADIVKRLETGEGSNRFVCAFCREDANRIAHMLGRATPRTRERWDPTLSELDENRQNYLHQQSGYKPANDSEGDSVEDIMNLLNKELPGPEC